MSEESNASFDTEILYRDFFTPVFRYLFFRTKEYKIATDLTQTTFLKFLTQSRIPETKEHAQKQLFVIARTTLIDYWRSSARRMVGSLSEVDSFPGTERNPEEESIAREYAEIVHSLLGMLSEEESEIVSMRLSGDVPYTEIAEAFGITSTNVRQIYSRALKKIGTILETRDVPQKYEHHDI